MLHPDPIVRRVHACVVAGVPVALIGPPGGGKTSRIVAYAAATDRSCERLLLSRCEPIDLKMRAVVGDSVRVFPMPELARMADRWATQSKRSLLFLDEFNRSTREVEGAALDVIDSPPEGVAVVVACNPPSRGQVARSLESAAANRFCHLDVTTDASTYAAALLSGWPTDGGSLVDPDETKLARETTASRSIGSAFIRHRGGEVLSREPTDPVTAGRAWPSPRSWDAALRLYAVARVFALDAEDTTALVAGCVGPGPAVEFLAFAADAEVDPEALLANPAAWVPPVNRVDKTIAALSMVHGALVRDLTDARWRAAWALVSAAVDANQVDAGLFATNLLISAETAGRKRGIKVAPSFTLCHPRIVKLMTKGPA
jgi:MoxR-like ATPase